MLLEILAATGAIVVLTVLTVFLPGWAATGSARVALKGWAEWIAGMAVLIVPAVLIGLLWAWLEFKNIL